MNQINFSQSERHAEFFSAVWKSLCAEAGTESSGDDRRGSARFPFPTVQLAAQLDGDRMPSIEAFETIQCHNISCGGFSYYSLDQPATDRVVLLIQAGGMRYSIEGRIVHSRPVDRNGSRQFLVGCKFTRRVDL